MIAAYQRWHPNLTSPKRHSLLIDEDITIGIGDVLVLRVGNETIEREAISVGRWSTPQRVAIEPIDNVVGESVDVVGIKTKQIEPYRAPHRRNA